MLEVGREDDGLVAGFTGELDSEIPRVEGHKGELEVVGDQVLLGKLVEAVCGITERTGVTDVLPSEGGE
jgi:hypothetical protein